MDPRKGEFVMSNEKHRLCIVFKENGSVCLPTPERGQIISVKNESDRPIKVHGEMLYPGQERHYKKQDDVTPLPESYDFCPGRFCRLSFLDRLLLMRRLKKLRP